MPRFPPRVMSLKCGTRPPLPKPPSQSESQEHATVTQAFRPVLCPPLEIRVLRVLVRRVKALRQGAVAWIRGVKLRLLRARQVKTRARHAGTEFPVPLPRARTVETRARRNGIEFTALSHPVMAAMHRAPVVKTRTGHLWP